LQSGIHTQAPSNKKARRSEPVKKQRRNHMAAPEKSYRKKQSATAPLNDRQQKTRRSGFYFRKSTYQIQ
jgi:hypothetical protein